MAEFLTTADISARLQKIVRESDEYLVLISPYLKVNPRIRELLEQKSRTNTHVRIIYGKTELQPEEREWIDSVPAIELCFRQSLHAKCYLNDKEAILTSLNLYEFSEQHNDEMGIVVSKTREYDRELYRQIYQEAEHIAELSEKIREVPRPERTRGLGGLVRKVAKEAISITDRRISFGRPESEQVADNDDITESEDVQTATIAVPQDADVLVAPVETQSSIPTVGFCIRCKAEIPANTMEPYCDRCYQTWNRFKNDDYPEKYCHICGVENSTSRRKPLCWDCYQNYKDGFVFVGDKD